MSTWQVLPQPNLAKFVEPDEFRGVRNTSGNGLSLVKNIWQRFPNQPPMPITHPAMQGDSAMFSGRKPVTMMHPIDERYFPHALKLSQIKNAEKRAATMHENELLRAANHDARSIALEQEHREFRFETSASQRLAQTSLLESVASAQAAVVGSTGLIAYQNALASKNPQGVKPLGAAIQSQNVLGTVPAVAMIAIAV